MGDRVFRALLRLLPEEVRAAYARDMEATFRAERRHADNGRSRRRLWIGTLADVCRQAPGAHLDILRRDTRLAVRTLAARPVALAVALLTLAVAIGANVTMYAVVQAVLFSPLPYQDADRLVSVREVQAGNEGATTGYLTFLDLRNRTTGISRWAAASGSTATLTAPDRDAERVNAMRVSREYFDLLGTAPALGRTFLDAEDQPGEARRVVILADSLWQRRFDRDPNVVGSLMSISGIDFLIVGVMPPITSDLLAERIYDGAELWTPLGYDPAASFACRTCRHLRVFGRVAPGVSLERADAELDQVFAALEREHPESYNAISGALVPLPEMFLGPVRPVLVTLWVGVGLLLLIACGNVAHLLLLRASERQEEIAIRTALGVSRTRLLRQFFTESAVLAGAGGCAGLALAWGAIRLVAAHGPTQIPRLTTLSLDGPTLLAALGLTMLSGLIFGVAPLRHVFTTAGTAGLRSGSRGTDSGTTWKARTVLVATSVALSVVLLVGSGLLVRSLAGLLDVDPGFQTDRLLTFELWASGTRFRAGESVDQIATAVQYYNEVLGNIATLPGVSGAAATTTLPLGGSFDRSGFHIEGRPAPSPEAAPDADRFAVTPDYFSVMRIPLQRGRLLDVGDRQQSERVAVINATAARTLFGGADPIGHRISLGPPTAPTRTIVGIVGDVAQPNLDDPVGPQVYVPQAQWAWAETAMTVVVRTTGDPLAMTTAVRDVVRGVDRLQPITNVRTMDGIVATGTGMRRFAATLLGIFAAAAVLLAVAGLYGSVSLMVAQRRREIGIRLALGANAGGIRRLILGHGLRPVLAGLGVGLGLAAIGVPLLKSLLYQVDPLDPVTFGTAAVGLIAVALIACLGPARRAGRIDPTTAVRD